MVVKAWRRTQIRLMDAAEAIGSQERDRRGHSSKMSCRRRRSPRSVKRLLFSSAMGTGLQDVDCYFLYDSYRRIETRPGLSGVVGEARHGGGYELQHKTDSRIAEISWAALGPARTVSNVGAGAGAYEPKDRHATPRQATHDAPAREITPIDHRDHRTSRGPPRVKAPMAGAHPDTLMGE